MSKLIAATLLGPNEAFWPQVKKAAAEWADNHVVVNDDKGVAWGDEAQWRKRLWTYATEVANDDDWIFILDADFLLTFDPRVLTDSESAACWDFILYDLWSLDPPLYRDDIFWRAHANPRPWLFRAAASPPEPDFGLRGIHTGHFPRNFPRKEFQRRECFVEAPSEMAILHLGWATPEVRERKHERYRAVWNHLTAMEQRHVESVMDDKPNLEPLPQELAKYL